MYVIAAQYLHLSILFHLPNCETQAEANYL